MYIVILFITTYVIFLFFLIKSNTLWVLET